MFYKIKLSIFLSLMIGLLSSFAVKADNNILLNGNFADTSYWIPSPIGFGACAGLYTDTPCVSGNSLIFSYPTETISQSVNLPSGTISQLMFSIKNNPRWFNDGLTLTLTLNNGQTAQVDCSNPCTTTTFALKLNSGITGATSATVSIEGWGNGWGGNYGPQLSNAALRVLLLEDVQLSLQNTVPYLQGIYALQSSTLIAGLNYDCNLFDENNICISTGGRSARVNMMGISSTNGLLIGAYRLSENVRIGAWLDQNLSTVNHNGIGLSNRSPMFGMFGVWNHSVSGYGWETKFSAGYGDKDMTVTRGIVGTSENGSGTTNINTQGFAFNLAYNIPLDNQWTASPYLGLRHTRTRTNAYTELTTDAVTAPLAYSKLTQESSTVSAGLKLLGHITSDFGVYGVAGLEQDFKNRSDNYVASGLSGLTAINFNPVINKSRPLASLGVWANLDKNQRINLSTTYRAEAFQAINSLSAMLVYTAGL